MGIKRILVTGSSGMIGQEIMLKLKSQGHTVWEMDIKNGDSDIRDYDSCLDMCYLADEIYSCFGIKGNPKMTKERPADFFVPMIIGNANILEAARIAKVKKFCYVSSIAVENIETDYFPAMAKLMGEKQIEAYRIQYGNKCKTKFCIVRPANVYGKFDNFHNPDAMVITSLIAKAINPKNKVLKVWGDGSQVRDFINAKDVASGMIKTMKVMPTSPINLCSGKGVKIRYIAKIIGELADKEVVFEGGNNTGAKRRVMKVNSNTINWQSKINIKDGIKEIWKHLGGK